MDRERKEREAKPTGAGCDKLMPTMIESICSLEWDQVLPMMVGINVDPEDPGQIACAAATDTFAAIIHSAVTDFFFFNMTK